MESIMYRGMRTVRNQRTNKATTKNDLRKRNIQLQTWLVINVLFMSPFYHRKSYETKTFTRIQVKAMKLHAHHIQKS